MNIRDEDRVSAVALVVEDSPETAAQVAAEDGPVDAGETTAQPPHIDAVQSDDAVAQGGSDESPPEGE